MHHDALMRTTVTLEPDTHSLIQRAMREGGGTFKQVVNSAIRRGLIGRGGGETQRPFVVEPRALGLRVSDPRLLRLFEDDDEVERFLRVTETLKSDTE